MIFVIFLIHASVFFKGLGPDNKKTQILKFSSIQSHVGSLLLINHRGWTFFGGEYTGINLVKFGFDLREISQISGS